MNEHDRENLNFLLSIDEQGLLTWFKQANLEDLVYAEELLQMFVLENVDRIVDAHGVYEANEYLKKFTKGNV